MLDALLGRFRRFRSGPKSDASEIVRQSCLDLAAQDTAALGRPIAISHRIDMNNIGDRSNPIAVQYATGRFTFWTPPAIRPSLLAIGAILHWATAKSHVWGTGMTAPELGSGGLRAERVWALRGKLTHTYLARQLSGLRDVPLGDPGYLIGRCVAALMPARAPIHQLGIIPHFKDRNHPAIGHLRRRDGVVVLGGWNPDQAFFKQLMACEAIASSSLHGLILAEAVGIPNTWVDFASEEAPSTFKYHDWFSLAKKPPQHPLRLTASPDAANIIASSTLHEMAIDENALRRAVPPAALDELSLSRNKGPRIVHFLTCRRRPIPIFLICGSQGHRLHDVVTAYRKQSLLSEPILVETDRVNQETRGAIDRLRREGAIVRGLSPGTPDQRARSLREVIRLHFKEWGEPQRFAVTTGSIDFSIASADSFAVYDELLNRFPAISGAGPMLRIRDLPQNMPHFARIVSAEINAHWRRPLSWCETSFGPAAIVHSSLGGTLALRRAGERYNEPGNGLRVHYPFEARNLDWKVADGPASTDRGALRIDPYTVVERGADGTLMTTTIVSAEPR